jgi:hypothetical protein
MHVLTSQAVLGLPKSIQRVVVYSMWYKFVRICYEVFFQDTK